MYLQARPDSCLKPGQHFGEFRTTAEMAGLTLTETVHAAHRRLPPHAHERPYVTLVLDGTWQESYGRESVLCRPLMTIFHPRGEVHSDEFGGEHCRCLRIDLDSSWDERLPSPETPVNACGGPASWIGLRLYNELRTDDSLTELAVEGLMLELLAGLGRKRACTRAAGRPRWLDRVIERLEAMDVPPRSVRELAALAGVHPVHFARVFRRHHGCTPAEYLRRLRLDAACRHLKSTREPIAEIALRAGFSDQSHLNRAFREAFGITPARFRAGTRG